MEATMAHALGNLAAISLALVASVSCGMGPSGKAAITSQGHLCDKPKGERTYVEPCLSTTTRNPDTPTKDVPNSVQVINRDLMDDQKALRVEDALRNVSGVQPGRGR